VSYQRILGLGTFPIVKPVHGGQRRVDAIRKFYQSIGIRYDYACIYDPSIYPAGRVGPNDVPYAGPPPRYKGIPYLADLLSGRQGGEDQATLRRFLNVVETLKPDALQLEHPFVWPLAAQILQRMGERNLAVIYSSHNVEAPLKRALLLGAHAPPDFAAEIHDEIEALEHEVCRRAALIICVSKSDRDHYLKCLAPADIVVVPNGVDRPPAAIAPSAQARAIFGDHRFLLMVGSAYPPNVDGACEFVMRDGAFHSAPTRTVAVCGGMSSGIQDRPEYRRFAAANAARMQFFPEIEDDELWGLKAAAHGCLLALPSSSGGTSLKTAEALTLGKWIVASAGGLRGFEDFAEDEGVIRADNRTDFRRAMAQVLRSDPIEISAQSRVRREALFWDRCFADSALPARLRG
jgi:glycosyltransferase involved in cell wall biosynthesis